MRLLLCAAGTAGDVHPLLAIAHGMRSRGHDVTLLANPAYAKLAEEAGVEFAPVGTAEELHALEHDPRSWNYAFGWRHWLARCGAGMARELYHAIAERVEPGRTVVAGSYLTLGARLAQEKLGLPGATLHLNSHTIRTIYNIHSMPPPMFLGPWVPRWLVRVEYWFADTFWIDPVVRGELNRCRKELGLPSLRRVANGWWHSPDLVIGLFPEWWCPPQPDWPPHVVLTDFPIWDRTETVPIPAEINRFLSAGSPPLLFTPGASGMNTTDYFATATAACTQLGCRGLLISKRGDVISPDLPPHMLAATYLPFRQVLPRVAGVVHHAGIGTTAQCLMAGVPQLVIPTLYNQPDTACRLELLGVARRLSPRLCTPFRLARELRGLLQSETTRQACREIAARFDVASPLPAICRHLERLHPAPQRI